MNIPTEKLKTSSRGKKWTQIKNAGRIKLSRESIEKIMRTTRWNILMLEWKGFQNTILIHIYTQKMQVEQKIFVWRPEPMNKQRIIRFPLPDYLMEIFDNFTCLACRPYCICYQHDMNEHGFGPYGFVTEEAKLLLHSFFPDIKYWDVLEQIITKKANKNVSSLRFYGDSNFLDVLTKELLKYKLLETKTRVSGKNFLSIAQTPRLFDSIIDGKVSSKFINLLIKNNVKFFMLKFIEAGARAGTSLILFNENTWKNIIIYCDDKKIRYDKINAIDELHYW